MGRVLVASDVLSVGRPYSDPAGQLLGWHGSPRFMVGFAEAGGAGSAQAWERLAAAVFRASQGFMNIDEFGNHVADDELGLTGAYTPNWVSEPCLSARGVAVYVDTGSSLSRDMGKALLRLLVEELAGLPFDTSLSRDAADGPEVRWLPPHPEKVEAQDQEGRPRTMVIARAVRCVVQDGVPGVTSEYLDGRGGWTSAIADARVFLPDERGTHRETLNLALTLTRAMREATA